MKTLRQGLAGKKLFFMKIKTVCLKINSRGSLYVYGAMPSPNVIKCLHSAKVIVY